MKRYAVYYGSIIARHCKSGTEAIFKSYQEAVEFAEEMNRINEGYVVVAVKVEPIKEKRK